MNTADGVSMRWHAGRAPTGGAPAGQAPVGSRQAGRAATDQVASGDAAIAEIVLDRPAAMNALNTAMAASLARVCGEIGASRQIRAVVLAASGERAFCVGADLKERAAMTDAEFLAQRPVFRAAFGAVLGLPQPVIAAVHGYALGGGCELALSCDLIVADETAVFGLPDTQDRHWPAATVARARSLLKKTAGPGMFAGVAFDDLG